MKQYYFNNKNTSIALQNAHKILWTIFLDTCIYNKRAEKIQCALFTWLVLILHFSVMEKNHFSIIQEKFPNLPSLPIIIR